MDTAVAESKNVEKHLRVRIMFDDEPTSPREWDNIGTMVCFHDRYDLGDKGHGYSGDDYDSWEEMEKDIYKNEDIAVILPLYLLDHSGVTMQIGSFGDPWDSGQVGFIYATKDAIREAYGVKHVTKKYIAKAEKSLRQEVITYDAHLRGDVYGFVIEECKDCEWEVRESIWGFFNDFKGFRENFIAEIIGYLDEEELKGFDPLLDSGDFWE